MKSKIILAFVLFLLPLFLATAEGKELLVDASQVASIKPSVDSREMRLLMQFEMPEELADKTVDFACVSFDASSSGERGAVSLEAFRLTTSWQEGNVSWSGPWTKNGGDWDNDASADWVSPVGEGKTIYLDVTDFVNGWLKEPSGNFGIIVKVTEPFTGTFSAAGAQEAPRLRILYSD